MAEYSSVLNVGGELDSVIVPEASTSVLCGIGFIVLGGANRWRRRQLKNRQALQAYD